MMCVSYKEEPLVSSAVGMIVWKPDLLRIKEDNVMSLMFSSFICHTNLCTLLTYIPHHPQER